MCFLLEVIEFLVRVLSAEPHYRVQSKDLVESSAQKASSVSPARFRVALSKSRRILETVADPSLNASPSRRTRSTDPIASPSRHSVPSLDNEGELDGNSSTSPFLTPKKKFKYSSGVDISELMRSGQGTPRHAHEPSTGSPLRHSVTPGSVRIRSQLKSKGKAVQGAEPENAGLGGDHAEADAEESGMDSDLAKTPTKKTKSGIRPGVDLETAADAAEKVLTPPSVSGRKMFDTSAFFALRPGSGVVQSPGSKKTGGSGERSIPAEDGLPEVRAPRLRREKSGGKGRRRKRDWTYGEDIWRVSESDRVAIKKAIRVNQRMCVV